MCVKLVSRLPLFWPSTGPTQVQPKGLAWLLVRLWIGWGDHVWSPCFLVVWSLRGLQNYLGRFSSWFRFSLCVGVVSVFTRSSRFVSVRLLSTCKSLLWVSLQLFIPQILVLVHVCPRWSAPREWNKKLKRFAVSHLCWIPSFLSLLHRQTPCGPLHTFAWAKFPSFRLLRNPEE